MHIPSRPHHARHQRAGASIRLVALLACLPLLAFAVPPSWWQSRGVLDGAQVVDDYAAANIGQLKNMALQAIEEMEDELPGGAGASLQAQVTAWRANTPERDDFSAANVGQLKAVAAPIYTRLIAAGYAVAAPWDSSPTVQDSFAAVNIGQLKHVFAFDLQTDSDQDGMPDSWEIAQGLNAASSSDASLDLDGDGITNANERALGTRANSTDSDGDTIQDGRELAIGANPASTDTDGDQVSDEYDVFVLYEKVEAGALKGGFPSHIATTPQRYFLQRDWAFGLLENSTNGVEPHEVETSKLQYGWLRQAYNRSTSNFGTVFQVNPTVFPNPLPFDLATTIQGTPTATLRVLRYPFTYVGSTPQLPVAEGTGVLDGNDTLSIEYTTQMLIDDAVAALNAKPYTGDWQPYRPSIDSTANVTAEAKLSANEQLFTLSKVRIKFVTGNTVESRPAIWQKTWTPQTSPATPETTTEVTQITNSTDSAVVELSRPLTITTAILFSTGQEVVAKESMAGLRPVEFKKLWETKNKANQIVVKARRDDPKNSTQTADADGNLYGTPRYLLYVTADPSDSKYHVSLDCELGGQRDQFVCAAYNGGSKISGTDKAFPAAANQPADMLIPATGSDQSGQDFVIKLAFDTNKNGLIDGNEPLIDLTAAKSETGSPTPPMIRGFSTAAVDAAKNTIHGQATGSGFTGWKPNFLGEWFVPNAQALERLFYDGATTDMAQDYKPTSTLSPANLDAFGAPGDFNEWLTHHAGSNFDADGVTTVQHYRWDETTRISTLIASSSPLSLLKSNSTITSQITSVTDATVESFKQSSVPVGQTQTFPSGADGYDLQAVLATLGAPHSSPSWVPKQTLLVGDKDGYAGAIPDDAFGTVGRSRFVNGEYRFIVKKEARGRSVDGGMGDYYLDQYTAIVIYLRVSGSSEDLYDFNHNSPGLSVPAAITQLSYSNGGYGRTNGVIFRATVDILKDYEVKEIRLP